MKKCFEKNGFALSEEQEEKLKKYYQLLVSYNKKVNLTSVTEEEEVWRVHFFDSALLLTGGLGGGLSSREGIRVLDVGSGAGFPGMVLAILRPDWEFVLLDSLGKRVDFLNLVSKELELKNVRATHGRAEELARENDYREGFDLVVSRAVAELRLLLELCVPFVKNDGVFVSYKGPKYQEEIAAAENAMKELVCRKAKVHSFCLDGNERFLLEISRAGELPERYPRRTGVPARRPL